MAGLSLTRRESLALFAGVAPRLPRTVAKPGRTAAANPTVAFHYQAHFGPRQLDWYTRFGTLVTGAILSPPQTAALRRGGRGPRLVAYEWASGYYAGDAVSAPLEWQRHCESQGLRWLLTEKPVTGNAAENGRLAHWYDFASSQMISERAAFLADRLVRAGYDGYFFDTVGDQCLAPAVRAAFQRRHPGVDYNECQGRFLAELRKLLPAGKLIFLNQGYRHAAHLLPHADLDLSESYFTAVSGAATVFRPWHDAARPWESIKTPMRELIVPALKRFPQVRMVHANYAGSSAGDAARARRYSHACAMLFGHQAYTILPGRPEAEEDSAYFTHLGQPTGPLQEEASPSGIAWRQFEGGVVALNGSARPGRIASLGLALPQPFQGYLFPRGV